jgi:hypothetical protein
MASKSSTDDLRARWLQIAQLYLRMGDVKEMVVSPETDFEAAKQTKGTGQTESDASH